MIEIKIITRNPNLGCVLVKRLEEIFINETGPKRLVLVDMNNALVDMHNAPANSQIGRDNTWVRKSKDYAKHSDSIIIFLTLEVEVYLRHDAEFADIITLPNVGFVDILDLDKLLPKYQELAEGKKNLDSIALAFEEKQLHQQFIEVMHRSIGYLEQDPSFSQSWVSNARYMGLSDREIVRYVKEWRPKLVDNLTFLTDLV